MKTNFRTLIACSLATVSLSILVGCGGSGASTGGPSIATSFASQYDAEVVPIPAGASSIRFDAISQTGKMVGSYKVNGKRRSFLFQNHQISEITNGDFDSSLMYINNSGIVSGNYQDGDNQKPMYVKNGQTFTPNLIDGASEGWFVGFDSQNIGYITFYMMDGSYRSFAYSEGTMTPITALNTNSVNLRAVSPDGHLVAYIKINDQYRPIQFDPSSQTWTEILVDIASPLVYGINDSGSVVGNEKIGGAVQAFSQVGAQHRLFATGNSNYPYLKAISAGNLAVGSDQILENGTLSSRAFAWSASTGYFDLTTRIKNPGSLNAAFASGIDNQGRIIGFGTDASGQVAFVLTPAKK